MFLLSLVRAVFMMLMAAGLAWGAAMLLPEHPTLSGSFQGLCFEFPGRWLSFWMASVMVAWMLRYFAAIRPPIWKGAREMS